VTFGRFEALVVERVPASMGLPDLGIITVDEVAFFVSINHAGLGLAPLMEIPATARAAEQ
jgi:hypothetical protein